MKDLTNQTILITGAAGGLGLNLAGYFAQANAKLILIDVNQEGLAEAVKRLEKYQVSLATYVVDQADKEAVDNVVAEILQHHGVPDVLINNAGIGSHGELSETSFDTWHKLMAVNFWGALHFVYAFLPAMKQRNKGHIINVATGQVFFRVPTWGAYTVTKTALATFSEILQAEIQKNNIKVTTVYPYMVNTGFYKEIETESIGGQLMLALLPFYSQSPQQVAHIIYQAVVKEKPIEMVSPLNYVGKYMRMSFLLATLFDRAMVVALSKEGFEALSNSSLAKTSKKAIDTFFNLLENNTAIKLGFRIDETMAGEHEFVTGCGPAGKWPFEFRVTWGTDNFWQWANPTLESFLVNKLEGVVTVGGLCRNVPCKGYLELRYFQEQKIRYVFDFTVNDKQYHFVGEKQQIFPWNLPWSHTTCFGELWDVASNKLISRSTTHFSWDSLPEFLKSFHLIGAEL